MVFIFYFYITLFRTEENFLNKFPNGLSENSKKRRKQRNRLTHLINSSSWAIETTGNVVSILTLIIFGAHNLIVLNVAHTLAAFHYLVLTPFSYLLNEKGMRTKIINDGWIAAIKEAMKFNRPIRHNV